MLLADRLGVRHDLRNGEESNQQHHQSKAVVQLIEPEGETGLRVNGGQAHGGQQSAQHGADQSLGHVVARQGDDHGQGEDRQGAVLVCLEFQGEVTQHRGQNHQKADAGNGSHEGEHHAGAQGPSRLALVS